MTRIAVVRALALGDMLCAIPTIRAIRARFPDADVALVGLPWARELVDRFQDYLDEHIEFPGWPGIPEVPYDPGRTVAFLGEMQGRRFDLAIQLQGDGLAINEFVALFGAGGLAGFVPPGLAPPTAGAADTWITYPSHGTEVDRLLALAEALGAPTERRLEFPVSADDEADLERTLGDELAGSDTIAVVHAGGSRPERRWPADRFAALADRLATAGLRVVLTGTAAEAGVTREVTEAMSHRAVDLAGKTGLGAVAALVARARLVLTNDTGISHLAAALGTDSVTVFSGSDPGRWAPVGSGRHLVVGGLDGGACRHEPPGTGTHRCLGDACSLEQRRDGPPDTLDIPVGVVGDAVDSLLA